MQEYIPILKILKTHGVLGNVSCEVFFENPQNFLNEIYFLQKGKYQKTSAEIKGKLNQDRLIISLANINTIEEAKTLEGKEIFVHKSSIPPLPEGEYYPFQIIGLNAFNHKNQVIGTVTDVVDFGSGINLEIKNTQEKLEYYVFNNNATVDISNQKITFNLENEN